MGNEEKIPTYSAKFYIEHKEICSARAKEYHAAHKKQINARCKKYHAEHREKINARKIQYRKENKERLAADRAKYYAEHKIEINIRAKEYRDKNKDKIHIYERKARIKFLYGLTVEEYDKLVDSQNNYCAICSSKMKKPFIDHDHSTREVRGLLCSSCNRLLGDAKDSTEILAKAIEYLNRGGHYIFRAGEKR